MGQPSHELRELTTRADLLEHLRLRHDAEVGERGEGARRAHGLDLSPHDIHARMFGAFAGDRLVATGRLVQRGEPGPAADVVRDLLREHEPRLLYEPSYLPGELVFDFRRALGRSQHTPSFEIGKVAARPGAGPGAERALVVGLFALALELGAAEAIAVCPADRVGTYARVCSVRQVVHRPVLQRLAAAGRSVSNGLIFDLDQRLMPSAARAEIAALAARRPEVPLRLSA